jgi:hypothetical protein
MPNENSYETIFSSDTKYIFLKFNKTDALRYQRGLFRKKYSQDSL